jgi:hypothetical protein
MSRQEPLQLRFIRLDDLSSVFARVVDASPSPMIIECRGEIS